MTVTAKLLGFQHKGQCSNVLTPTLNSNISFIHLLWIFYEDKILHFDNNKAVMTSYID